MSGQKENEHEVDFYSLSVFFLSRWRFIASGTALFLLAGLVYSFIAKPVYQSEAVITPRESQSNGGASALVSQFGGLGGVVATQFGLMNADLDKLQILLQGRELAQRVIVDHDLLPRLYPERWDARAKRWKKDPPRLRPALEKLRSGSIFVTVDAKKKVIRLEAHAGNPALAVDLVNYYLDALNVKIQEDTRKDADANRAYLAKQMWETQDPILRERIQNLIVGEVERYMLVSVRAFDVLEAPAIPMYRLRPSKSKVLLISALMGLVFSCAALLASEVYKKRRRRA